MIDSQEEEKSKPVLDGIPVEDKAFPISPLRQQMEKLSKPAKTIVGACCCCGSPIYGHPKLLEGDEPEVVFSCKCHSVGSKQQLLSTKEEGMAREGK